MDRQQGAISTTETEIQHANVTVEKTLCIKRMKKIAEELFYAGENEVYAILPRTLMHRLFYYSTAVTEVKVAQGIQVLMQ